MTESKLQLVYREDKDSEPAEIGAIYTRISTPGQEDGTSPARQEEISLSMAALDGVHVPADRIIREVWSGADPDRAGLNIIRGMIEREEVRHIYIFDTDRLARDPLVIVLFIRLCKDHGVTLHFGDGTVVQTLLDEIFPVCQGFYWIAGAREYPGAYLGRQDTDGQGQSHAQWLRAGSLRLRL